MRDPRWIELRYPDGTVVDRAPSLDIARTRARRISASGKGKYTAATILDSKLGHRLATSTQKVTLFDEAGCALETYYRGGEGA